MAFKQGEVYRCPDPDWGCEGGNLKPRCCCGKEMEKVEHDKRSLHAAALGGQALTCWSDSNTFGV